MEMIMVVLVGVRREHYVECPGLVERAGEVLEETPGGSFGFVLAGRFLGVTLVGLEQIDGLAVLHDEPADIDCQGASMLAHLALFCFLVRLLRRPARSPLFAPGTRAVVNLDWPVG